MTPSGPPAWPPVAAAPGRPARPATVTVAFGLLVVAAALLLVPLVAFSYELTHFDDVLRRAAERTGAGPGEVNQERATNQATSWVGIGVVLFMSTALFVPALWMRRGNPVARMLSSAAAGVATLCCCSGIGLATVGGQGSSKRTALQSEANRLAQRETPGWVGLSVLPVLLVPVLALTVLILLLMPSSNRFFRPPAVPQGTPYPYHGGYYTYPAPSWESRPPGSSPGRPPDNPGQPPA